MPAKLLRRTRPTGIVKGLPATSVPPIHTRTLASLWLTLAIRSCVSILLPSYQGNQYTWSTCLAGNAIISEKLVGRPPTPFKITRSATTIFCVLTICTGPLSIPLKLFWVLAPAAKEKEPIFCPAMDTLMLALVSLTLANRSWVLRSLLLYQGNQ